jgi:hypothetical protein
LTVQSTNTVTAVDNSRSSLSNRLKALLSSTTIGEHHVLASNNRKLNGLILSLKMVVGSCGDTSSNGYLANNTSSSSTTNIKWNGIIRYIKEQVGTIMIITNCLVTVGLRINCHRQIILFASVASDNQTAIIDHHPFFIGLSL